ncbi:MAG: DUF1345 domain-containing protein [Phenylobacterium sp.]
MVTPEPEPKSKQKRGPRPQPPARRRAHVTAAVAARGKLVLATVLGVVVGLVCSVALRLSGVTDAILAWDTTCVTFIGLLIWGVRDHTIDDIRLHAAREDQGRATILLLVITAAAATLGAVGAELGSAKHATGWPLAGHVILVVATVTASWFMTQLVFAVRYAHEYYDPDECDGAADAEGLEFPGGKPPDFWDFLHFSVIIGVACQTADVNITDKGMRRLSTLHSLVAFSFNTVIVALTINLLAGLF